MIYLSSFMFGVKLSVAIIACTQSLRSVYYITTHLCLYLLPMCCHPDISHMACITLLSPWSQVCYCWVIFLIWLYNSSTCDNIQYCQQRTSTGKFSYSDDNQGKILTRDQETSTNPGPQNTFKVYLKTCIYIM